jgi:glycosyltransferase involved in cell wall biosynthesis
MNIVVATAHFPPEPNVQASLSMDIATELAKKHHVTVLSPRPSRPAGFNFSTGKNLENTPFTLIRLKTFIYTKSKVAGRSLESISLGRAIASYIRKHRKEIDVVYATVTPFFAQFIIACAIKKNGISLVMHIQDIYPEPIVRRIPVFGNFIFKCTLPVDKYILRNSTRVITIGEHIKKYIAQTRKIDEGKFVVVNNWQDESRFSKPVKSERRKDLFTYMFLGNLAPAANLHYLIDCFAEACLDNARLVLAGSGNLKEPLMEQAKQYTNVKIEFCDAPSDQVHEIQSQADVLLLPLRKAVALRCFPSKFPAYLFSKRPVLACVEHGSDVELSIRIANCGWAVEPEDKEGLVEHFKSIAQIPADILDEKGRNGYEYCQTYLTRKVNLEKLVNTITSAANDKKL